MTLIAPLPRRRLGRSLIEVSVLGFGGAPLGDLYARLDDGDAIATVEAAHAAGITLFDTSPHYGHGLSEHRFGTALRRVARDSFVLSTKVAAGWIPADPAPVNRASSASSPSRRVRLFPGRRAARVRAILAAARPRPYRRPADP
ncbi:MAG: aldo/keto reductase [Pseudomonadota bacterium]